MTIENGRAERAPLLHRSTSVRAIYPKDDEIETGISTLRGAFIISSIGLLIFLQGILPFLMCRGVVISRTMTSQVVKLPYLLRFVSLAANLAHIIASFPM